LLEALKILRLSIAKENRVPAFVVFSDSTLTDMCMKMPATIEELLDVSGVGQVKAERYGQAFLDIINNHTTSDDLGHINIRPTEYRAEDVSITEEAVTVSAIADRINVQLIQIGFKKLTGVRINDWLIAGDYLMLTEINGKNFKVPTEKGEQLGITAQMRDIRGETTSLNFFDEHAQRFIAKNAKEI